MTIEDRVLKRLQNLIDEGQLLGRGGQTQANRAACGAWFAAAEHIVSLICPNALHPYRAGLSRAILRGAGLGDAIAAAVDEGQHVLANLLSDVKDGLISSVVQNAKFEIFDDLLDQAEEYLKRSHLPGAAVLASAAFEDVVRQLRKTHDAATPDARIDQIISDLEKCGAITVVVAKRCRAAAGIRNKALHAKWDEVTLDDVRSVIPLTRELLGRSQ